MADKAGIWLRVSTADQHEEAQYPDCSAYAELKGYEINPECVYQVHGASARKGNKRFDVAWAQVIDDIRHNRVKVLIVWRLSRLDRKLNAYQMIKEVTEYGARIEFSNQPHLNDLSTMAGRISLHIEEEIAFAESEEKSQRATASIALRKSQGRNTGRYPYGLMPADGVLVPTPEGRRIIPMIFERTIAGRTPGEIAAMLRAEGTIPNAHPLMVRRILANEKYRGLPVDTVTWDAAQDAVALAPKRGRAPKNGERPLMTPRCALCSGPMYPHAYRDSRNKFYRCYMWSAGKRGCGGPLINMATADSIVTAMFTDDSPHTEWVYVPGDDIDRQVRGIRDAGAVAMRKGDYARAMELMKDAETLEASPRIEAGWQEQPTGETQAEWWAHASLDDKRAYLAQYVFTLGRDASGDVTVTVKVKSRL